MLSTQVHAHHASKQAAQLGKAAALGFARSVSSSSSSSLLEESLDPAVVSLHSSKAVEVAEHT